MFPTWPAKSEQQRVKRGTSPRPPEGGLGYSQLVRGMTNRGSHLGIWVRTVLMMATLLHRVMMTWRRRASTSLPPTRELQLPALASASSSKISLMDLARLGGDQICWIRTTLLFFHVVCFGASCKFVELNEIFLLEGKKNCGSEPGLSINVQGMFVSFSLEKQNQTKCWI